MKPRRSKLRFERIPRTLVLMPVFLLLVFIVTGTILYFSSEIPRNNKEILLQAIGISGFIGIFGQLSVSIAQEYNKHRNYNIRFIAKGNSPFSAAILNEIQAAFSNISGFELTKILVDHKVQNAIAIAIEEAIENSVDGLIIRPSEVNEKLVNVIIKALGAGIFVVLVDIDIASENFPQSLKQLPFFVGSDFSNGGKLVSEYINKFLETTPEESYVYLLLGPESVSAVQRGKSIAWDICRRNNQRYTKVIWLSDWTKEKALDILIDSIKDDINFTDTKKDRIFIFCANDNIACFISEQIFNTNRVGVNPHYGSCFDIFIKKKDIQIMGYDGLTDDDGNFKIMKFACSPVTMSTVNVNPAKIGHLAAETIFKKFGGKLPAQKRQELIPPELVYFDKKCP